jgi:hypothetical protein
MTDQKVTLEDLQGRVRAGLAQLRDGEIPAEEIPTDEEATAWVADAFTDQGGRLRMRKSAKKGASDQGNALRGMLRWHRSGGTLDGMMMARWTAGRDAGKVDTLATLVLILSGERSSALAAWERTGLVGRAR